MKRYVRFEHDGNTSYGTLDGETISVLNGNLPENFEPSGTFLESSQVNFLIPCTPEKIIGLGANYSDTQLASGQNFPKEPLYCIMPPTALLKDGGQIRRKDCITKLACETELGIVIGKQCSDISAEDACKYIWGYVAVNDVTAKNIQELDGQWTRCKSFDTFLPISTEIVADIDISDLQMVGRCNGNDVQTGSSRNMIFKGAYLVSFISKMMTLNPGDIIITGTPGGNGFEAWDNDEIEVWIENIGKVKNTIKAV